MGQATETIMGRKKEPKKRKRMERDGHPLTHRCKTAQKAYGWRDENLLGDGVGSHWDWNTHWGWGVGGGQCRNSTKKSRLNLQESAVLYSSVLACDEHRPLPSLRTRTPRMSRVDIMNGGNLLVAQLLWAAFRFWASCLNCRSYSCKHSCKNRCPTPATTT